MVKEATCLPRILHCGFIDMSRIILLITFAVLLLCSPIECAEGQEGVEGRVITYDDQNDQIPVSSAVENAKNVLGIITHEDHDPSQSSGTTTSTRKIFDKIKKEFNTKILHGADRTHLDTDEQQAEKETRRDIKRNDATTSQKVGVKETPTGSKKMSIEAKSIPVKGSEEAGMGGLKSSATREGSVGASSEIKSKKEGKRGSKNKELSDVISSHLSDTDQNKQRPSEVDGKPLNPSKGSSNIPKTPDLIDRSTEYVKTNLVDDAESSTEVSSAGDLIAEESALKDTDTLSTYLEGEEESSPDAQLTKAKKQDASPEKNGEGVPPLVASKLEQEVVSAIKVRSQSLSNTSISPPAHLLDDSHNYFTDNGEQTMSRFQDPRHFFTNLSSKGFSDSRAVGIDSQGKVNTQKLQKVIIFSQPKGLAIDDGKEEDTKTLIGGETSKAKKITKDDAKSQKNKKELDVREDTKEETVDTSDIKAPSEDSEKVEKNVSDVTISPTTVKENIIEQETDETEKSPTEEKLVDEQTKSQKETEKEKKDDSLSEKKEGLDAEVGDKDAAVASDGKEKTLVDVEEKREDPVGEVDAKEEAGKEKSVEDKEKVSEGKEKISDDKESIDKIERIVDESGKGEPDKEITLDTEQESGKRNESESKKKKGKKKTDTEEKLTKPISVNADEELPKDEEGKPDDTLETYSQFTQRVSAEKKNDATNGHGTNGHSKGSKVKGKNYASPDCGAKLVTANPEASHSSKVIHPNKDEYMLNKCRDKIWFVIELCESIRPQKFDIANFELFSNLPKDIQVFGSHRYPSRDWTSFGWFKGQEGNRGLQSFRVETEEFFKYIKVEVTSNYGSEFFCPISSFQIYGLSEFEVIDTIEDQAEDSDDDNEPDLDPVEENTKKKTKEDGKQGVIPTVLKNMFSGVLDVIKRGYRPSTSASEPGEQCYSLHPRFAVEDTSCPVARSLNYILSCYKMEYEALMLQPFVSSTVKNSSFCRQLALTMCAVPEVNDSIVYDTTCNNSYVCVMLSPKHVLAMCFMQDPQIMDRGISCESGGTLSENISTAPDVLSAIDAPTYVKNADINTSTITRSDAIDSNLSESIDLKMKKSSQEVNKDGKLPIELRSDKKKDTDDLPSPENLVTANPKVSLKESKVNGNSAKEKATREEHTATPHVGESEEKIEIEGSGLGGMEIAEEEIVAPVEEPISATPAPPTPPAHPSEPKVSNSPTNKESVVVRLSNKIKALEYNMSISSQYLEELSRRYKRQMEEMQRQFNLTIAALNNTSTQAYERDQNHQRDIEKLEEQLSNVSNILQKLVEEREALAHTVVEQHVLLMVIEVIVLCVVFTVCSRRRNNYRLDSGNTQTRRNQTPSEDPSGSSVDQDSVCLNPDSIVRARVRRRSVDSMTSERNSRLRQRRPSEEALNISGTYQDLLIIEPAIPILMDSGHERKKKRKSNGGTLKRSKSNASIADKSCATRRAQRLEKLNVSSAGVLFCGDEVDSKSAVLSFQDESANCTSVISPHVSSLMHDQSCNNEGSVFHGYADNPYGLHGGSVAEDICMAEGMPSGVDYISKRHSVACVSCDHVQKKEASRLSKSLSVGSAQEKLKGSQEKVKKVKKQKRAKVKDVVTVDPFDSQSSFIGYSKDYYTPKTNGNSYCLPSENFENYYYNGYSSPHPSDHQDHTYSRTEDVQVNGGYSNGVDVNGVDVNGVGHYQHMDGCAFTNHDTSGAVEKKKTSPKVKSKVKLRSDNWEWYLSQHAGNSSSETISTCSDSSGKKKKEDPGHVEKSEDKKAKRKKKSKSKSPVLEEETVLEVGGT